MLFIGMSPESFFGAEDLFAAVHLAKPLFPCLVIRLLVSLPVRL
jgi:hypothetical protein